VSGHVIHARFGGASGARSGLAYIAHREELIPGGRSRRVYGLGTRYEARSGDEQALAGLLERDGHGMAGPRYYRLKLTVNDATALAFGDASRSKLERALSETVERTFRRALPRVQGVYAVHSHSRKDRRYGHPHVHVHLSPALAFGGATRVSRAQLADLKLAWGAELKRTLTRGFAPRREMAGGPTRGSRPRVDQAIGRGFKDVPSGAGHRPEWLESRER
jgi:hypothetical protein